MITYSQRHRRKTRKRSICILHILKWEAEGCLRMDRQMKRHHPSIFNNATLAQGGAAAETLLGVRRYIRAQLLGTLRRPRIA